MYVIEDEVHSDSIGQYVSLADALAKLEELEKLPWFEGENQAPCSSWRDCGRVYIIFALHDPSEPQQVDSDFPILEVSAVGTRWLAADEKPTRFPVTREG